MLEGDMLLALRSLIVVLGIVGRRIEAFALANASFMLSQSTFVLLCSALFPASNPRCRSPLSSACVSSQNFRLVLQSIGEIA
jgi:hypothetical protein